MDAETQMDEFTPGRAKGSHFALASRQQALIGRFDVRVVMHGDDGGHVKHRAVGYDLRWL